MTKETLRKLIAGFNAVAEFERLERLDHPGLPQASLARLVSLVGLAAGLHGWPLREDAISKRELVLAREAWDKLRRRLAAP